MSEQGKTGVAEWADASMNVCLGCANGCRYCYACAMATRMGRRAKGDWRREEIVPNWWKRLPKGEGKRVMMPTSHDVTPGVWPDFQRALWDVLLHSPRSMGGRQTHGVLIVTKARVEMMRRLMERFGEFFRERIEVRVTIGSADDGVLGFWEPGAPGFEERLHALEELHDAGWRVSVSVEPMLDDKTLTVWDEVKGWAETVWIGEPNRLMSILSLNGFRQDRETWSRGRKLVELMNGGYVGWLYRYLKDEPQVRWKDSVRRRLGLGKCGSGNAECGMGEGA
jgi:hypothetical protein